MSKKLVLFSVVLAFAVMLFPTASFAASRNAYVRKKWGAEIRRQLTLQKVFSVKREAEIINIIAHESGGNPRARNGSCVGLLQFNSGWRHNYTSSYYKKHRINGRDYRDDRLSPYWSIYRIVKVYKEGGDRYVARHWRATINL